MKQEEMYSGRHVYRRVWPVRSIDKANKRLSNTEDIYNSHYQCGRLLKYTFFGPAPSRYSRLHPGVRNLFFHDPQGSAHFLTTPQPGDSNNQTPLWCSWLSRSAVMGIIEPKGHRLDSGRGDFLLPFFFFVILRFEMMC